LSELLRAIGSVLDELDACNATVSETPDGFAISAEIGGIPQRHVYTYIELARRLAS
jgi:hypothetical protein